MTPYAHYVIPRSLIVWACARGARAPRRAHLRCIANRDRASISGAGQPGAGAAASSTDIARQARASVIIGCAR